MDYIKVKELFKITKGKIVKDIKDIKDEVHIKLHNGSFKAKVIEKEGEK